MVANGENNKRLHMGVADFRNFLPESANTFINLYSKFDNSIKLQQSDTMDKFLNSLLAGSNNPPEGTVVFDPLDYIRLQNGHLDEATMVANRVS